MAVFPVQVVIDPSRARQGAAAVDRSLKTIEDRVVRLQSLVGRAFAFAGLSLSIRQLAQLSETYTRVQNRIRLVTEGEDELAATTQQLFDISQRTRASFEATATIYTRTAAAAQQLGRSQEELIQFTENLNKTVAISGANSQEAAAALIQLSQGIGANRLGGEELRSVLEQLPAVADKIAASLGVTRGELRKLGSEGKLSANTIIDAFTGVDEDLNDKFAATTVTLSSAFQKLGDAILKFVGEADKGNGVSATLAKGISALADNAEALSAAFTGLVTGVTAFLVVKTVGAVVSTVSTIFNVFTGRVAALNANAALAGPATASLAASAASLAESAAATNASVTLLSASVTRLAAASATAAPNVGLLGTTMTAMRAQAAGASASIGAVAAAEGVATVATRTLSVALRAIPWVSILTVAASVVGIIASLASSSEEASNTTHVLGRTLTDTVDPMEALAKATGRLVDVQESIDREGETIQTLKEQKLALELLVKAREKAANQLKTTLFQQDEFSTLPIANQEEVRGVLTAFEQETDRVREQLADVSREAALAANGFDLYLNAVVELRPEVRAITDALESEQTLLKAVGREREIQARLIKIETDLKKDGISVSGDEQKALRARIEANLILKDQADVYDDLTKSQNEYKTQLAALNALQAQGRITGSQYNQFLDQLRTSIGDITPAIREESLLLRFNARDREIVAQVIDAQKKALGAYTPAQLIALRTTLEANRADRERAAILDEIQAPQQQLAADLAALKAVYDEGALSANQYAVAVSQVRAASGDLIPVLQGEADLLRLSSREREIATQLAQAESRTLGGLTDEKRAQYEAEIRLNQALRDRADILDAVNGPQEEYNAKQRVAGILLREGEIDAEKYGQIMDQLKLRVLETGTSFEDGLSRGLIKVKLDLLDVASAAETTLTNAFGAGQEALTKFVTTGKGNFREFAISVITDIERVAQKLLLSELFKFVSAQFSTGPESLPLGGGVHDTPIAAAAGADFRKDQLLLVGEKGPELVRFGQQGNVTPANETRDILRSARQDSGGRSETKQTVVNVTINGVSDFDSFRKNRRQMESQIQSIANGGV